MSDFLENMNKTHGAADWMGNMAAISQRDELLAEQKKHLEALQEQVKIDKSRADIEEQRLQVEKNRLAAEEAERAYRHQQDEQVKQLRNLLADSVSDLNTLAKIFPA